MVEFSKKQIKYDTLYMDLASRVAEMSYAIRLKVGAICVKDGRIISHGWNGMPAGFDNCCEYEVKLEDTNKFDVYQQPELITKPEVIHAEQNTILKLSKDGESGNGSTLYITHSPCMECSKMIIQSGIKRVIYKFEYRSLDGINFLKKANIEVVHLC